MKRIHAMRVTHFAGVDHVKIGRAHFFKGPTENIFVKMTSPCYVVSIDVMNKFKKMGYIRYNGGLINLAGQCRNRRYFKVPFTRLGVLRVNSKKFGIEAICE